MFSCIPNSNDKGASSDILVVKPLDEAANTKFGCSEFNVRLSQPSNNKSSSSNPLVTVQINGTTVHDLAMYLGKDNMCRFRHPSNASPFKPNESVLKDVCQANKIIHPGTNKISFITTYGCNATCYLFLWLSSDSIIISDIDGTITRSDVVGVLDTVITETFKHIHHGICDFFSSIVHTDQGENMEDENKTLSKENPPQIRMLYLTSRPLTLVNTTRRLFHRVRQGDKPLPLGPIFCYRGNILDVLVMEKISKSADRFKGNLLKDQITHAFATAGRALNTNLFVAAFGNKISDATAYESAGIRKNNIYIIDPTSKITVKKDIELNEGETENLIFDSYEDPNLLKDLKQKLQET